MLIIAGSLEVHLENQGLTWCTWEAAWWAVRGPCPAGSWYEATAHLLFREVVLAQRLPQLSILAQHGECGGHLAECDDVPPIRKSVQDVVQCVQGEVAEREAMAHLLGDETDTFCHWALTARRQQTLQRTAT